MEEVKEQTCVIRGCMQSDKVDARKPLEDVLEEERKRVHFEQEQAPEPTAIYGVDKPNELSKAVDQDEVLEMKICDLGDRPKYDRFTVGVKGYGQPPQHPAWQTSSSTYGRYAPPPGLNKHKFPRNNKFTKIQGLGGIIGETMFNTSIENDYIYKHTA